MSEPKTLLQMAGADLNPAPLSTCGIVVIDAQNEYVEGPLALPDVNPALDRIAVLLDRARQAGRPIVHIAHKGRAGGPFDRDADRGAIVDRVAPVGSEAVIEKGLPNAFAGTELESTLRDLGLETVIFAGFMTHMCVSSTARCALDLGFNSVVVSDASGTRALPDPTGGPALSAADLHRAVLAGLADRFAIVSPLDRIPD